MKRLFWIALLFFLLSTGSKAETSAHKLFQPFVDAEQIPGAVVLVADADKILSCEAIGYANLETKRPMKTDDLFWIASQTKPMTAAAVLILVDEGKIALDDAVEKYLPEFKGICVEIKRKDAESEFRTPSRLITIRDLLTHTSGLIGGHRYTETNLRLENIVSDIAKGPLEYDPGTNYKYSGAGFSVAGRIIEVVSGKPYAEFLRERLLGPLGMKNTTFWPTEKQQKQMASAYRFPKLGETGSPLLIEDYRIAGNLSDRNRLAFPGGGLFSTAEDVSLLLRMLLNRGRCKDEHGGEIRILSETSVDEMTKLQTADGKGGLIGGKTWGIGVELIDGGFGHEGAFKTEGWVHSKNKIVSVMLVQIEGYFLHETELKKAFSLYTEDVLRTR